MKLYTHIVIGMGEVGEALYPHLKGDKIGLDKDWKEKCQSISSVFLHICMPYFGLFEDEVIQIKDKIKADAYIVHSTVPANTTETLNKLSGENDFLYSPIMGRHKDNFTENIKMYHKFVAGDERRFKMFEDFIDIALDYWGPCTSSLEFSKAQSTNYMYWNLIYQKCLYKYCEKMGWDFKKVYEDWNVNYNNGIRENHSNWERPIYDYDPDPIPGGHCLKNNVFLNPDFISQFCKEWQNHKGDLRLQIYKS